MKLLGFLRGAVSKVFESRHESWMFLNQFSRLFSGVVIIGFLARLLESEVLGVWYIFVAIFGVSTIAEMGFNQIFMRHIAYYSAKDTNNKKKASELNAFIKGYRKVYFILVSIITASAFIVGAWWMLTKVNNGYIQTDYVLVIFLWLGYVLAGGAQLVSTFYAAITSGMGDVATAQRNEVIGVILNALVLFFLLLVTQSLIAPVVAYAASRFVLLLIHRKSSLHVLITKKISGMINGREVSIGSLLGKDASRMVLIMAAYQLLTSGLVLVFSHYESPLFVASYGLTNQVTVVVVSLTSFWIGAVFPQMSGCKVSDNLSKLRILFWGACRKTFISLTIGLFALATIGGGAIDFVGSKTPVLSGTVLHITPFPPENRHFLSTGRV
jgi:O-antigen/teichoic acid export membrane protein